ncbi:MAG: sensor histidine kinase [Rikenellaceae bacterium]|nr:sensor histidine kinase [Rikenellaceae bacterium]
MKIQTRLSLFSLSFFGGILLILSVIIYFVFYRNTEREIYRSLEKSAFLTAFYYLEKDELSEREYQPIYEQFHELINEFSYQLYDEANKIIYSNGLFDIDDATLEKIRDLGSAAFTIDRYFCLGIYYEDNEGDFVVIAFQPQETVKTSLNALLRILLWSLAAGLVFFFFASRWIARRAYYPFRDIINEVLGISPSGRLPFIRKPHTGDELEDLVETFNQLLDRINQVMDMQKDFVKYISHEFRTPLASIMGNLEVFSLKDRKPEEYRELADSMIYQISRMNETLDTLLWISGLRQDAYTDDECRIDEVVWEIINRIKEERPSSRILFGLDVDAEHESLLTVKINRIQIYMCLYNLIHNAVKFSNDAPVRLDLSYSSDGLVFTVSDNGIGFTPEKLERIQTPFLRGANASDIQGNGLGLIIALRILEKNHVDYRIESVLGEGTDVRLYF